MLVKPTNKQILVARLIDFIVIGLTFYVSCSLLAINFENNLIVHIFMYSSVVLVSLRFVKCFLSSVFSSSNWVVTMILGNATGFLTGACAMVILQFFIPEIRVAAAAIFVASIMAFFVLGTVAPLLKLDRPFSH